VAFAAALRGDRLSLDRVHWSEARESTVAVIIQRSPKQKEAIRRAFERLPAPDDNGSQEPAEEEGSAKPQ
jgi:hypothetical protein